MTRHRALRLVLLLALAFANLAVKSVRAETSPHVVPTFNSRVPPHLGYGISVGPHSSYASSEVLDRLGMDWVKLYDTVQIANFPHQRILFRVELNGPPDDYDAWERGMYEFARELSARGVDAVEIGNEMNLDGEWGGHKPNAGEYVRLLAVAYRAFKQADPRIVVLSGGLASTGGLPDGRAVNDLTFAAQMLQAGAGNYLDAWAYHPYGYNVPPEADPMRAEMSFRRAERMYQLLLDYGVVGKQIWITEFGWLRDPGESGVGCDGDPSFAGFEWVKVSGATQANWTVRAFQLADSHWPWAGPMFLWNLDWDTYDTGYEPLCSQMRYYSLLNRDGSPTPAFNAVANMPKRFGSYTPMVGAMVSRPGDPEADVVARGMSFTVEAGCGGLVRLGSFKVINVGYPGPLNVEVMPANGPGRPVVSTSVDEAHDGTEVEVFVDTSGVQPGLHLVAVNLRSQDSRGVTSHVVRGWLLVHYPTTPECVQTYMEQEE
jgi:hypothetical protein